MERDASTYRKSEALEDAALLPDSVFNNSSVVT